MTNNFKVLESFLCNNQNLLIINYINDEISSFYNYCIEHFAKKKSILVKYNDEVISTNNDDLFGNQHLFIWFNPKNKLLNEIINSKNKNIIFLNYTVFKKIKNEYNSINSYQNNNDIRFLLTNILKIDNQLLIDSILRNPELIFSETSKYSINPNYLDSPFYYKNYENLTDLRIKMTELKKMQQTDLLSLFNLIKSETLIKKFSFLTY